MRNSRLGSWIAPVITIVIIIIIIIAIVVVVGVIREIKI